MSRLKSKSFCLLGFSALSLVVNSCKTIDKEDSKPNVLLLLADDLGYGELGCYGQKQIKTPVLDSLAKKGVRFTQFYAGNAVCAPSRASLITGKHPGHCTIRGNAGLYKEQQWDRVPLKKEEATIGEVMKTAGYQTAFIGKWHVEHPNDLSTWAFARGFDFAVQPQWSSPQGGDQYDERVHWINNKEDSLVYDAQKYDCIDVFRTNIAIDYLKKKKEDQAFFLFMSYRIPHARENYIRDTLLYANKNWPETERIHAARITLLDSEIGRLLNYLERTGELDNTLVLFTSDNGAHGEGGHSHAFFQSTGQLRGYKRDLYEGGIRVPALAYWKGKIQAGSTSNHMAAFWDIMPTLTDLTGTQKPKQTDGISFLPEMLNQEQKKHDYLYWEVQLKGKRAKLNGGYRQALRKGEWKAVRYGINNLTELYNLKLDPFEQKNLAKEYPQKVDTLNSLLKEAHTETDHFPYGGLQNN